MGNICPCAECVGRCEWWAAEEMRRLRQVTLLRPAWLLAAAIIIVATMTWH